MGERFRTTIEVEGRTATFFEVPLDVRGLFGRARPPVRVTICGHTYRSTIAVYGGRYFLPLNRANRAAAGVAAGETVTVEIEADDEPRTVDVPDDLRRTLAGDAAANAAFEELSYSHRKEFVDWIAGAKREDTRRHRIEKTLERLRAGGTQG
jgi:Bacteriocin-protection, YdeI or OmpD-Associated/Domain of unknown function (DUF1905)